MAKRNNNKPEWLTEDIEYLFKAILKIRTKNDCEKFLRDLLTINEIKTLSERLRIANLLNNGYTYKKIEKLTGTSSTTIARVNRWLEYGEGGYKLILKRLKAPRKY